MTGLIEQVGVYGNVRGSDASSMQRVQLMQRRISLKRPSRALLANSGSAMPARTMPTRSQ